MTTKPTWEEVGTELLLILQSAVSDAERASNPRARFFLYDVSRAAIARAEQIGKE